MSRATKTGAALRTGDDMVRVYEDPGRRPGELRVLVDRLRPRGILKATLDFDERAKDVAPSSDLRRWDGHDPVRFGELARRYRAELALERAAPTVERRWVPSRHHGRLAPLTATCDVEHSGAALLVELLAAGRGI